MARRGSRSKAPRQRLATRASNFNVFRNSKIGSQITAPHEQPHGTHMKKNKKRFISRLGRSPVKPLSGTRVYRALSPNTTAPGQFHSSGRWNQARAYHTHLVLCRVHIVEVVQGISIQTKMWVNSWGEDLTPPSPNSPSLPRAF